jgi:phosphatidylinositol-3-phosphatase
MAGAFALAGLGLGLGIPAAASGPGQGQGQGQGTGYGGYTGQGSPRTSFPHMTHVFVIFMENETYQTVLTSSNTSTQYIQTLAHTYGLETEYYGVTHTSLPNYVAVTSGNTWGSNNDTEEQATQGFFSHLSIFDQFDQAHISWKAYEQSLPSVGYTGDYGDCTTGANPTCTGSTTSALYVRKHDPPMQYTDIFSNPRLADNVVPLTQLTTDLRRGTVPQYSWITPNICDDMHGTTGPPCAYPTDTPPTTAHQATLYTDGNTFLKTWVPKIMDSRAWTGNSAIFITWDEGGYENVKPYGPETDTACKAAGKYCGDAPVLPKTPPKNAATPKDASGGDLATGFVYGGGHIPMIVVARQGARGATDAATTNHYSLLQTIEANFGLPFIGDASDTLNVTSLAPLLKR